MHICAKCVLPETFPGIRFDAAGVCNYCLTGEARKDRYRDDRERYRSKFHAVLNERRGRRGSYDVIMAYSGGKDSSYTLKLLREEYGLSVLALTFDHGFVSPQAVKNIQRVTEALNAAHMMISPKRDGLFRAFRLSISEDVYPLKTLERASSVCNTCMHLVKAIILKTALEMNIPLMVYGWSPGQAPVQSSMIRLNSAMIRQTQSAMASALGKIMTEDLSYFTLEERHYRMLDEAAGHERAFYNVNPLAFTAYNEQAIIEEIKKLGWEQPKDTDANSTNCLLNGFANEAHLERYKFHPYALEIAGLVRTGCMKREDGLAKLAEGSGQAVSDAVRKKLGL